jgi:hypothetical protein
MDTEHTCAVAARRLDLSGGSYGGLLDVSEVEMPYGAGGAEARYPPAMVAFRVAPDRQSVLVLSRDVPAAGQVVRVRWTAAHAVTAEASTVPAELDALVTLGAAGFAAIAYSMPAADYFAYDDGETVGRVDDSMVAKEWRVRGAEQLRVFRAELGRLRERRARTGRPWVSWRRAAMRNEPAEV